MQMLYLCHMGIFSSKCADLPKAHQSEPCVLSELGAIINALYALRRLEIEAASDLASDKILTASSFDSMCNARLKLKEELEHIESENEAQILRYQSKAKAVAKM